MPMSPSKVLAGARLADRQQRDHQLRKLDHWPAGTSAEDLQSARALLRAACWAADVRIIPGQPHSHLVTIDVIRRGPAGAGSHRAGPGGARSRQPWCRRP
jgi:hypothetical protein